MAEASENSDDESLLARLLSPLTNALDAVGRLLMLTSQSLIWMIRPPYRFMQLLLAMDFIGPAGGHIDWEPEQAPARDSFSR